MKLIQLFIRLSGLLIFFGLMSHARASSSTQIIGGAIGSDHSCVYAKDRILCTGDNSYGEAPGFISGYTDIRQVEVSSDDTCILDADELWCYGKGSNLSRPNLVNPRQIALGGDFFCALDDEGVKCWGDNEFGQTLVPTNLKNVTQIAAGNRSVCAVDESGIHCWGTTYGRRTPPPSVKNVKQIQIGWSISCVLDDEGVKCWGSTRITKVPKDLGPVLNIAVGSEHACATLITGKVRCWGPYARSLDQKLSQYEQVISVLSYNYGGCVLTQDGLFCDAHYNAGKISPFYNSPFLSPERITANNKEICAITPQGPRCWGIGTNGITADLPTLKNVKQIAMSNEHACSLDDDGVKCWGKNEHQELKVPAALQSKDHQVLALFEQSNGTCALMMDRKTIQCWGAVPKPAFHSLNGPIIGISTSSLNICAFSDSAIECTDNNSEGKFNPPQNLTGIKQIVGGVEFFCALSDQGVTCWGEPSNSNLQVPAGLTQVKQIASSNESTCALSDQGITCWGKLGKDPSFTIPSGLQDIQEIVVGEKFACALQGIGTDTEVKCWAAGNNGSTFQPPYFPEN